MRRTEDIGVFGVVERVYTAGMRREMDGRRKMKGVLKGLRRMYGAQPWQCWGKGVDILVETILSQNTSNANSSAGYRRLRRKFGSWNQVMNAPVEEVEKCIRISGLSRIKAPRIQSILRQIKEERGKVDLEFLKEKEAEEAFEYLMHFEGVGPKTANCVLLFSFGTAVFPVDTHIHRIAIRLGVIPEKSTAEEAHRVLKEMIEPGDRYEMHVLLVEHGRRTCKARGAECERCELLKMCPYGKRRMGDGEERRLKPPLRIIGRASQRAGH